MDLDIYYKGQIVQVNVSEASIFEDAYRLASEKLNLHFSQELQLLINNVRLRVKRTNHLVKLKDFCKDKVVNNDTIVIEPEEKTVSSVKQNAHAPKRYQLDNINNDNTASFHKPLENINELVLPIKTRSRVPHDLPSHKYQKSDQINNRNSQNYTNYFDRNSNGLRRSLGAAIAPQFDITPANYVESNGVDYLSDSSISDFNGPSVINRKSSHQNNSSNNAYQDVSNNHYKHKKSPSARKRHKDNINRTNKPTSNSNISNSTTISKSAPASPNHTNDPSKLLQSINASGLLSQKNPVSQLSHLTAHNVRTIGEKIHIRLQKKPRDGLGFTLVTRDNPVIPYTSTAEGNDSSTGRMAVILVNKILARGGAADSGGLLMTGDRILEVNGKSVASLKETTDLLRGIVEGEWVDLVVSRRVQQDNTNNNTAADSQNSAVKEAAPKSKEESTSTIILKIELPEPDPKNLPYQLGMKIQDSNSTVVIHTVIPDSLAAQAGFQTGDVIVAVNHQSTIQYNAEFVTCLLSQSITKAGSSPGTINKDARTIHLTVIKQNPPSVTSSSSSPHKYKQTIQLLPNKMPASVGGSKHRSRRRYQPPNHNDSHSDDSSTNDLIVPDPDAFSREARGRRSMSEKRKAHEDPTQFRFYQSSRLGSKTQDKQDINTDRLYNTLPIQLQRKKRSGQSPLSNNQPPPLPSKTGGVSNQQPVRPSHIKQMQHNIRSTGNSPTDSTPPSAFVSTAYHQTQSDMPPRVVPRAPIRSVSLRNSAVGSTGDKARQAEKIKRYSQIAKSPTTIDDTDSIDSPHTNNSNSLSPVTANTTMFNRAMNNSFKRAVHRSIESSSNKPPASNPDQDDPSQAPAIPPKSSSKYTAHQSSVPRSQSLKYAQDKSSSKLISPPNNNSTTSSANNKKSFSYKKFINFTPTSLPNSTKNPAVPTTPRPKSSQINNTKSDTYPTNQYNSQNEILPYTQNYMHTNDPIIENSNKRVVEWQLKNADFMAKPQPDNNQYAPASVPNHAPRLIYNTPTAGTNTQKSTTSSPKRKIYESHKSPVQSPVKSNYQSNYDSTEPPYETLDRYNNNSSAHSKKKSPNESNPYSSYKRYATSAPYSHNPTTSSATNNAKRSTTPITTKKHVKNTIDLYATVSKHTGRNYMSGSTNHNKHASPSPGNRNHSKSRSGNATPSTSTTVGPNKHSHKIALSSNSAKYKF